MKFYLSSYKLGDKPEQFATLFSGNKKVGYIPNALDYPIVDFERKAKHIEKDMNSLREIGLNPSLLDLRDFFGNRKSLEFEICKLGGVFVSGGSVFILRQAMRLSGFDIILVQGKNLGNFVYGGYSAGVCVLSPTLEGYSIVDPPTKFPYEQQKETIWEGIGLISYAFLPHYESNHPQSENIQKEAVYCSANNIPYRVLRDGDVIIINEN